MAKYIDIEEALNFPFANGIYDHDHANKHFINGCESYREWFRQIPAADVVERKTGKWIIKDNPGTGWYRVTCSACGEDVTSTAPVIGFFPDAEVIWNYCPECGSYNGGDDDV